MKAGTKIEVPVEVRSRNGKGWHQVYIEAYRTSYARVRVTRFRLTWDLGDGKWGRTGSWAHFHQAKDWVLFAADGTYNTGWRMKV